jgi:hypothetical protein
LEREGAVVRIDLAEDQKILVMKEIKALVDNRGSMYDRVLVELALLKRFQPWRIWFGCFRFLCEEETTPEKVSYDYETLFLTRRVFSVGEVLDALSTAMRSKVLHLRGLAEICLEGNWGPREFSTSDSPSGYLPVDWPTTRWEFSLHHDQSLYLPDRPLAQLGRVPLYPDAKEAIRDFFRFRELDYFDISTILIVMLPDFRGKIKELRIGGKRIKIRLDVRKARPNDLIVKLYCRTGRETIQSGDLTPSNNEVAYDIPDNPIRVLACLMLKTANELIDWKEVDLRYPRRKEGVIIEQPEEFLRETILRGESDTVEHKELLPQNPKELMETIVAFANGRGGTIFLGVTDDCRIAGLKQDIQVKVRDWAKIHCDPPVDNLIEIKTAEVDGNPIWLIQVSEGQNKPYLVREKGIIVRSGASDRQITRAELDDLKKPKTERL